MIRKGRRRDPGPIAPDLPDVTTTLEARQIRAAMGLIPAAFSGSPQFVSDELSERAGRPVIVKIDSVNPVGAFKGRGAWLAVGALASPEGSPGQGVGRTRRVEPHPGGGPQPGPTPGPAIVVASTGNFGAAVAYAGRAFGVPVTVYAQEGVNRRKLDRIGRFGATVRLAGRDFDEAREHAARHARESGATLLVDGEDPWIAVGAGTLAAELTDAIDRGELPPIVAAYVPVGNGALIAGVGTWLRGATPAVRVIGVQSEAAPSMTLSWQAGHPVETPTADTRAGGIATRVPVREALKMMVGVVDDMVLVSETAIAEAAAMLTGALGITVELAAAASWAGLEAAPAAGSDAVAIIVTGSNAETQEGTEARTGPGT